MIVFPEEAVLRARVSQLRDCFHGKCSTAKQSLGKWLVSIIFDLNFPAQTFTFGGKEYSLTLRPERYYKPYAMYLEKVTHEVYPGTTINKNFASDVAITHQNDDKSRDALIYMNHPLRYEGLTYYQFQMIAEQGITRFQVVRNPSWLVPYISVGLVGLGMTIQFLQSLLRFSKKSRRTA